ncbi:MAG TPA: TolC family protein [Anaeromyxobacteraceae bacterium]|nr:TolC family protein [Anaeromyxobacteraceae bacterium]
MKCSRWGRLCLLAMIPCAAPQAAAAEPQSVPVLRWPEVAAAVDRHPLVAGAEAARRGAAGAVATARALPDPILSVSMGEARSRVGGAGGREWSYTIGLPLDLLATRGPRVAAAEATEASTRQDAAAARAEALRELRRAFVALAHDEAAVETTAALEGQAAQLAALVRKRAERGEARPTEVPRVEMELERLRGALDRARAAAEGARQRLTAAVGRPVGRVEADLSLAPSLPALDALRERVLASSPILQASRARVDAAAAGASAERWERFPKIAIEGTRAEEPDRRTTTFGATVALPVWSWNGGRVREADAAVDAERARLDAAARELTARLGEAWQACAAGQAVVRRFGQEILPRAERSAGALGRAFELGEVGLLDVIDARRTLLDTRREALDVQLDMQNACGDLAALAGLELP